MAAKPEPAAAPVRIRIDKWLWHARFFKTRSLAAAIVAKGGLRINGVKTTKPGHSVGLGDVLTFRQDRQVRVIRVLAPGSRRGPAAEARLLYADLDAGAGADAALPPE